MLASMRMGEGLRLATGDLRVQTPQKVRLVMTYSAQREVRTIPEQKPNLGSWAGSRPSAAGHVGGPLAPGAGRD